MYQDYKDLLSAFQSHGVKYLVVGGFAVIPSLAAALYEGHGPFHQSGGDISSLNTLKHPMAKHKAEPSREKSLVIPALMRLPPPRGSIPNS